MTSLTKRSDKVGASESSATEPINSENSDQGLLDRRTFVYQAVSVTGAALAIGVTMPIAGDVATAVARPGETASLTAAEMNTLKSLLSRLLPRDELGPGAIEIGVHSYIDNALAGPYRALLPVYQAFFSMLDSAAAATGASLFRSLTAAKQNRLLEQVESGEVPGLSASAQTAAATGFKHVLAHMREGLFADPMYGGNRDAAGWRLIGFPGVQLVLSERLQKINAVVPHTSATARTYGGAPFNGPDVN